jgi:hypothetical protein
MVELGKSKQGDVVVVKLIDELFFKKIEEVNKRFF